VRPGAVLLAVMLLPLIASAALEKGATLPGNAFMNGSLQAEMSVNSSLSFTRSPSLVKLLFTIDNPLDRPMDVYIAVKDNGRWTVLDRLGTAPPRGRAVLSFNASFQYAGKVGETDEFAAIGELDGHFVGRAFTFQEQWDAYESYLETNIAGIGMVLVPIGVLVAAALGLMIFFGVKAHMRPRDDGEYTVRTLFFPHIRGRPLSEVIADLMINPFFWLIEALCGLFLVAIIFISTSEAISWNIAVLIFAIGGVVCWLMPFTYLVSLWLAETWEREPFRFPAALFMWGIFAAFIAFWANTAVDAVGQGLLSLLLGPLSVGLFSVLSAILIAPLVEELLKGFGVLIASGHHELDDTFDGILYGFAAGVGFAAIENWFYFAAQNNPAAAGGVESWLFLVAYRSIFNSLGHGWFTACTGGVIGFMKSRQSLRRYAVFGFVPGILLATALHAMFNFLAVVDGLIEFMANSPLFVFNPVMVVLLTLGFTLVIIWALKESRQRAQGAQASPTNG